MKADEVEINLGEFSGLTVKPLWVSEPRELKPGETFSVCFEWPALCEKKTLRWVLVEDGGVL